MVNWEHNVTVNFKHNYCTRCDAREDELSASCVGRTLSSEERLDIATGKSDFIRGVWITFDYHFIRKEAKKLLWMLRSLDCGDEDPVEVCKQRRKLERLVGIFPEATNETTKVPS